ncbi:MAG TPA: hypothetical protein VGM44_21585, partial [Polyangiaceae bacterium]
MRRSELEKAVVWLVPLAALLLDLTLIGWVLPHTPVRDETTFYPAAQAFAKAGALPSLEFLRHYPAPQAPLSLYWAGRLLSLWPSLELLRVANSCLMCGALFVFARFAARQRENTMLAPLLLALNPYFHLVATHFYTDALYFACVVAIVTQRAKQPRLALTLAPLARQFGVIFPLGEALFALGQRRFRAALGALASLLPLALLCLLWHGLTPDTPRAEVMTDVHRAYGFFFPYVAAYHVAALGFYLAPALARVERSPWFWVSGAIAAFLELVAPAHQNFSARV